MVDSTFWKPVNVITLSVTTQNSVFLIQNITELFINSTFGQYSIQKNILLNGKKLGKISITWERNVLVTFISTTSLKRNYVSLDYLHDPLDEKLAKLPVHVFVIRLPKRQGLIRARLAGADVAKGKVLTFLDSHCEASRGWVEPLLAEIALDRYKSVC